MYSSVRFSEASSIFIRSETSSHHQGAGRPREAVRRLKCNLLLIDRTKTLSKDRSHNEQNVERSECCSTTGHRARQRAPARAFGGGVGRHLPTAGRRGPGKQATVDASIVRQLRGPDLLLPLRPEALEVVMYHFA